MAPSSLADIDPDYAAYVVTVVGSKKAEKVWMDAARRRAGPMIRKAKIERMLSDPLYRAQRTLKRDDGGLEFQGPKEWIMTPKEAADLFADGSVEELEAALGKLDFENDDAGNDDGEDEGEMEDRLDGIYLGDINGQVGIGHIKYASGSITKTIETVTTYETNPSLSNDQAMELKRMQDAFLQKTLDWAAKHNLELAGGSQIAFVLKQRKAADAKASKSQK